MTDENTIFDKSGRGNIQRRCRKCRLAWLSKYNKTPKRRAQDREYKRRRVIPALPASDPRHGTVAGYNAYPPGAQRCAECTEAIVAYHRVRRLIARARKAGLSQAEIDVILQRPASSSVSTVLEFKDYLIGSTFEDPVWAEVARRVS